VYWWGGDRGGAAYQAFAAGGRRCDHDAAAGFEVTALDLSAAATQLAQAIQPTSDHLSMFVDPASTRPGGTLAYVTADFLDAGVCPGPFDVIIERRTVHLFHGSELRKAMEVLTWACHRRRVWRGAMLSIRIFTIAIALLTHTIAQEQLPKR
jgi:hypothetical protein